MLFYALKNRTLAIFCSMWPQERSQKFFFFFLNWNDAFLNENIIWVLIIEKSKIQIEFFTHFDSPKLYMS